MEMSKQHLLSNIAIGNQVIIDSFTDDFIELKLLEMGVIPGEQVMVERSAPLGDPIAVRVANSLISIRLDEADHVLVRNGN